jgi:hypothetical protein
LTGYTDAPASSTTDEVRFWLADTDTSNYEFSDNEIAYLLSKYTNPILAAARGCQLLANKYAMAASLGDLSLGSTSANYAARAKELQALYNESVSGTIINIPTTLTKVRDSVPTNYPSRFRFADIEDQSYGTDDEDVDGNSI